MDDVAYQSVYRINWLALHEYNSIGGLALGLLVERREDVLDLPAPLTLGDAIQLRGAVISKREHCSIKHVCHVPSCKTRRYQWLQWQPRPNGWMDGRMDDGSGVRHAPTSRWPSIVQQGFDILAMHTWLSLTGMLTTNTGV